MAFRDAIKSFFGMGGALEDGFFDDLADLLTEGDVPAAQAAALADELRRVCRKERVGDAGEARARLAGLLAGVLAAVPQDGAARLEAALAEEPLVIILLFGVNGVGKTTTAAKLARRFADAGRAPVLAAADTFRAAAIDQLKAHGARLGTRVVAGLPGGDPAACVYDAIQAARAGGLSPVIADTAGRMHTKAGLVDELRKIDRVIRARAPDAALWKYLVLDATTGGNATAQAETFLEAAKPDGVILTKCDSSAKGGAVFPLAARLGLPVAYLCAGEEYQNIRPFSAETYVKGFLGE